MAPSPIPISPRFFRRLGHPDAGADAGETARNRGGTMTILTRRTFIAGAAAGAALATAPRSGFAADARELKISHQSPGGTATEGDFRDRLCQKFAARIAERTNNMLKCTI